MAADCRRAWLFGCPRDRRIFEGDLPICLESFLLSLKVRFEFYSDGIDYVVSHSQICTKPPSTNNSVPVM
jgi:hypothetical protein